MPSFRALKIFRKQYKLDCTLFAELRGRIRGHYHESSDFSPPPPPNKNLGIENFKPKKFLRSSPSPGAHQMMMGSCRHLKSRVPPPPSPAGGNC